MTSATPTAPSSLATIVPARGLRNKNPGNLRHSAAFAWLGEIEPDAADDFLVVKRRRLAHVRLPNEDSIFEAAVQGVSAGQEAGYVTQSGIQRLS